MSLLLIPVTKFVKLNLASSQTILYKSFKNYGCIISPIVVVPWMNIKFPSVIFLCSYKASIAAFSISWKFSSFTDPFGWLGYSLSSNTLLYPIWVTTSLNSTILRSTNSVHFKKNSLLSNDSFTPWDPEDTFDKKHFLHINRLFSPVEQI